MSQDHSSFVRRHGQAANSAAPEVLAVLAADPIEDVRRQVACRQGLPADIAVALACDADLRVRAALAANSAVPAATRAIAGFLAD